LSLKDLKVPFYQQEPSETGYESKDRSNIEEVIVVITLKFSFIWKKLIFKGAVCCLLSLTSDIRFWTYLIIWKRFGIRTLLLYYIIHTHARTSSRVSCNGYFFLSKIDRVMYHNLCIGMPFRLVLHTCACLAKRVEINVPITTKFLSELQV